MKFYSLFARRDKPRALNQTLRVMKLIVFLLTATFLQVSAAGYAQKVTLSLKNASLERVLGEIKQQTDYNFLLVDDLLQKTHPINIRVRNASLKTVLDQCFQNQPLTYTVAEKTVIVKERLLPAPPAAVPLITISGRVTDEKGEPLPGAVVKVSGTALAVSTNVKGEFELRGIDEKAVLQVSFIGFTSQEIALNGQSSITIVLRESSQDLKEVVVVGFGTQRKVNVTGAVSTITARDIENRPITSISAGLQGLLPGLTAVAPSGMPGASGAMLRIRGLTSLNTSEPFVVVDGVPQDLNNLNPDDIESVSLLKDAASSSIYGSRAANGVIIITTKKGKTNQKPALTYNGYYGVQTPTALPEMLGSPEYMTLLGEAQTNSGLPTSFTPAQIEVARNGSNPNYFANTNWFDAIYKDNAPQMNHNISASGGANNINYYFSFANQQQQGLAVGDNFKTKRNNFRSRLNATKILDFLDIDANIGFIDRKVNQSSWATAQNSGVFFSGLQISPLHPLRFTNGAWGYGGGANNPVAVAYDGGFDEGKIQQFTANVTGTAHLHKNLNLKIQYGLDAGNQNRNIFTRKIDYNYPDTGLPWFSSAANNTLDGRQYNDRLQTFLAQLDYQASFGKHNIKALAGTQSEWVRSSYSRATKTNFLSDDVPVMNLGTANPNAYGDAYQYALRGYYARVNYDFKSKYLLELNMRIDGSSKYSPGSRWGSFPSASAGWRFTQEKFFTDNARLSWFSEGKIRVSYGLLGNQYNSDGPAYGEYYPYVSTLGSVGTIPIGNVQTSGFAQTVLSNVKLEWEKVNMANVGLDLAFLNNRLTFTGEWYKRQTKDIQLKVSQPAVIGVSVPDVNAGQVNNTGWELNLGWTDEIKKFRYGFNAQLSDVKNKVVSLGGVAPTIANNIRMVGFPINSYYGYRTSGLAQETDFSKDPSGKLVPNFPIMTADVGKVAPGDLKFVDLNGDGLISADKDRTVLGDPFPHYTYSFRGNVGFKQFDLSFFLQGVGKADSYISGPAIHPFYADAAFPQQIHLDHWTPQNTGAWYPRLLFKDTRNTTRQLAEHWLQDASYLRLKNVQVSYTLPENVLAKLRISRLKVYASADNLFTRTDFFYAFDPESVVPVESSGDKISNGGFYPQVKTVIFGINLTLK